MVTNAHRALTQLLEFRESDRLLIITDDVTHGVADAWVKAAKKLGATAITVYRLPGDMRPLRSIPDELAAMIPGADVAITAFSTDPAETPFRVDLLSALSKVVRRLAHSPGITEKMMVEGGMNADYTKMAMSAGDLIRRLQGAVSAHVTATSGTDIIMDIRERAFSSDTTVADGTFGNLPCGEIWCAPHEDSASGILVCDGSIGDLGQVPASVRLVVSQGRVTAIHCSDAAFQARIEGLLAVDSEAAVIGELGIGINPAARIIGNLLEDEKAANTAHIAFGNNVGMPGGQNRSSTHRDFLFHYPTISITFEDGREERIVVAGKVTRERQPRGGTGGKLWSDILVAVDFNVCSEEAIVAADMIARQNNARLIFCHVINRAVPVNVLFPQYSAMNTSIDVVRQEEEEAFRLLNAMVTRLTNRAPDQFETLVFAGDPVRSIIESAEQQGVDLIIVAARPDRKGARRFLGSAFKSVAENATCDVLVVR
jgi:leucyl aminopeptidase (aminopeptidase T)/nucleotide-binding universal stress UspA family protein